MSQKHHPLPAASPFTVAITPAVIPDASSTDDSANLEVTPFARKRLADIADAAATFSPRLELEHLRAVVAKRYAPGWLRKILGFLTGLQDNRPIMDELAVMREQGGARFTQLEAAASTRLDNLAGKIERLEASIDVRRERDDLKKIAEDLNQKLVAMTQEADHWRHLSASDREAMNAHLEQLAADRQASEHSLRVEIEVHQTLLNKIAENADILSLTNAFRICAAGGQASPEFDLAIATLERLHAELTGQSQTEAA